MGEEAEQKPKEFDGFAITQAGGEALDEAYAMVRAAEMLRIRVETLLEGVFTPFYKDASFKSALGLKRMAAVCLLLYSQKSDEEREWDE